MNKNLKKVISAAAALAISASSLVAFAASFPDVADTASYAQAVNELTALGVINGYDDGTFGPDQNVTRAEFAAMTVRALGTQNVDSANSKAAQDTQFTDVPGTHWAAGWVKEGTDVGFINGYSDTEFGPNDNITYAQAVKMLVCAVGYDFYAQQAGGWPAGYLSYGVKLGITNGISGVGTDTIITRAQVAQMIDNAVKAPICVVDDYTTNTWGNREPEYKKKDTTSTTVEDSWQSLLDYGHDVYDVYGRVTVVPQSGLVKNTEVKVNVEKSNNFNGYQIVSSGNFKNTVEETMYIGESKADQHLFEYAEMLISKDEDDEYTVLTIVPQGKNTSETFAAADFDDDYTVDKEVKVYKDGASKSTSYKLNTNEAGNVDVKVYVNSVPVTGDVATLVEQYIYNNASGEVTLIDSPDAGKSSADGYYDYIMVSYYNDAIVDSVTVNSDTETVVYFDTADVPRTAKWTVDTDTDSVSYQFDLAGAKISAADLQEDDVLSIAYDVTKQFEDSASYIVYVSRDTVSGTVNAVDKDDDPTKTEYTLSDGNVYKTSNTSTISNALDAGTEYVLYLNAFGRIAKVDEEATSKLIGVVDSVYVTNGDEYSANVFTKNGTKEKYTVKDSNYTAYYDYCYDNTGKKYDIQNRVFEYKVNSKNEITLQKKLTAANDPSEGQLTYKSRTNKLGSYAINDSITTLLDIGDYADDSTVKAITTAGLDDEENYTAYVYDKKTSGSTYYSFILIDTNGSGYTVDSPIVIYSKTGTQSIDGETKDTVYAYANVEDSAATAFVLSDDITADAFTANLTEGDPIILKKNSSGEVTEYKTLFADGYNQKIKSSYADFFNAVTAVSNLDDVIAPAKTLAAEINAKSSSKKDDVDFYFGPVVDKSDSGLTLGKYVVTTGTDANDQTVTVKATNINNAADIEDLTFDSEVKVFLYDYSRGSSSRVQAGIKSSIAKTNPTFDHCLTVGNTTYKQKEIINWESYTADKNVGDVNYALVKTVGDDVTEVYVIIPAAK